MGRTVKSQHASGDPFEDRECVCPRYDRTHWTHADWTHTELRKLDSYKSLDEISRPLCSLNI